ncbi:YciI family protein [Ramlibacter sp.]|uniref:YciI family protein n=1 Tax=Ramlibacter sp. TaxID=1917967 RepID=UPI002CFEE176|nr:YciI family protein [Ramlibacter sp.]HWI83664.1 YciI family protein [Ramlibacter sp.]
MLFAVIFTDKPGHGPLRAEHLQAHVEWVARHQETVLVAGSLRTQPEAVPKGGLWVVEAPSKEAVLELMKSDPFHRCGLRQEVEVLHWNKALEKKVLV